MTNTADNRKRFYVVQFIGLPYEGIDDYVCVPDDWVVIRRKKDQKVVVAYPKDEDRFVTRERVKREEKYDDYWKFWTAEQKYETDSFDDANFWIATRNDYGPLVSQYSSSNDTPPTSTPNKKFRGSKQKSTSASEENTSEITPKPFQITRKPLPKTNIKKTASDGSKPQFDIKRCKAAQPTGAGSQSTNEEPEYSSMPSIIEDRPLVIDIDKDDHVQRDQQSSENNNNSQSHPVIDMTAARNHSQDNGNSSSNFQPQIASIQSLATTSNNQTFYADDSSNNGPSSSQDKSESIATEFYKKIRGKPSLKAKHPAVEKKMRLENAIRNVAILLKDPPNSVNENIPLFKQITVNHPASVGKRFINPGDMPLDPEKIHSVARKTIEKTHNAIENPRVVSENVARVVSAPLNLSSSPQQRLSFARQLDGQQSSLAPDQHIQQTTRRQNLLQRLIEPQRRDPRLRSEHHPGSAVIDEEHLYTGRPYTGRPVAGFDPSRRTHKLLNRRVARLPISPYRRPVSPSSRRSIRSTSFPQETIRMLRAPSSLLFSNLPNSVQRALLANTHSNLLSEQEASQSYPAQTTPIVVTRSDSENLYLSPRMQAQMFDHTNGRNQVYYQDEIDRSYSPSDSGVGMDHDEIFDYQVPAEEEFVETTNNANHSQSNSRFVSKQQIKYQFASTSAQMASTLNCMVNAFEDFRTSILETAASYQTLLENMERFNASENQANQALTSRHMAQKVPLFAEERQNASTGNANFNGEREENEVVNDAPERNPNRTSRLILPPEYDPNDTRWTLKYHEHRPGLVELMPHTNVYVDYGELKYLEETSSNSISLARRVLPEVFSKEALSVCSSMTEKGHDYSIYPDERPKLNDHGFSTLLNYILEHGLQRGWRTDMQSILRALHDRVKEMRFRFGVRSR